MAGKRQAASVDKKRQVLDVETIASVGHGRRRRERERWPPPCAAKLASFKPRRRAAEEPPARRQRKAARGPAQVEIAGRGAAGRRQLDASDRLPADFSSRELREPGDDLRAPEVGDLEVDFEALESVRVYGHPVAVRSDRERLLARQRRRRLLSPEERRVSFVRTSGDRSSRLVALKLKSPVASASAPTASAPASRAEARLSPRLSMAQPPSSCLATCAEPWRGWPSTSPDKVAFASMRPVT